MALGSKKAAGDGLLVWEASKPPYVPPESILIRLNSLNNPS